MSLQNKNIAVYISGGIAAYKTAELVRLLIKKGAHVQVAMTEAAAEFISPLTLEVLSKKPVYTHLFEKGPADHVPHIQMADWADLSLVVPATANTIAKLTWGLADDFVSTSLLAASSPVVIAPAMNTHMWHNPATVENIRLLKERGLYIIEPDRGFLAEGYVGNGRLAELSRIVEETECFFQTQVGSSRLQGKKVLITSGGTKEAIDPVRYITNKSSGKMGHALALAARNEGAIVTLVSASALPIPLGVTGIQVTTSEEMRQAVLAEFEDSDIVIMAAAVSDYRPVHYNTEKIKKNEALFQLELEKTKDILTELSTLKKEQYIVGFAAETTDIKKYALKKLKTKKLDLIAANDVSKKTAGFDVDTNEIYLYTKEEEEYLLPLDTKERISREIVRFISEKVKEQ